MLELLFLLLPIAAFSGWLVGVKSKNHKNKIRRENISSKYFSGLNYILNEQPDRAVDVFLQLLDKDSEMVDIHLMLGNLFRKRGEVDRAIKVHKSILVKPNLPEGYINILNLELAKDYISAGLLDRAEAILLELVGAQKELEASLNLLISIYQESKDWDKAISASNKLQYISRKDFSNEISHFYCEIALLHLDAKSFMQAKRSVKQALKYNPNSIRAGIILADIQLIQNKHKSAIKIFEKLVPYADNYLTEIVPKMVACYRHLSKSFNVKNSWDIILKNNKSPKVILAYVNYLQAHEGELIAIEFLNRHLHNSPSILGLSKIIELNLFLATDKFKDKLENFNEVMAKLIKKNYNFKCKYCGLVSKSLEWQCPSCRTWDSFQSTSLFEIT